MQAMFLSRSPAATATVRNKHRMNEEVIPVQDNSSILEKDIDEGLKI